MDAKTANTLEDILEDIGNLIIMSVQQMVPNQKSYWFEFGRTVRHGQILEKHFVIDTKKSRRNGDNGILNYCTAARYIFCIDCCATYG